MPEHGIYCCTHATCLRALLNTTATGLVCPNGHQFPFIPGTQVPVFAEQPDDANEYARKNAAEIHDNALRWVFSTFNTDETTLRNNLVRRLNLNQGDQVLITGAGAGNDLPFLLDCLGSKGAIYAQDIAREMLVSGMQRHHGLSNSSGVTLHFSVSDATELPFADNCFDAAYHFGGINLFPDIRKGIAEMNRVVKPGGKVVIGDEGVAPWLMNVERGKMLIRNNPLYACEVPLALLPESAANVRLSWELSNCFYVIEFNVADALPPIDIDVPHAGTRGGSIRSRYFGQLEGVDPELRDRVFSEAARRGISRVEYLESILKSGLHEK